MSKHTPESIAKVLKEIQESIPANIRQNVVKHVEASPTVKKIVLEAYESSETREDLKAKLKVLIESGELDRMKVVEDRKRMKIIDDMVKRKINKAIKEGRLPSRRELAKFKFNAKSNTEVSGQ